MAATAWLRATPVARKARSYIEPDAMQRNGYPTCILAGADAAVAGAAHDRNRLASADAGRAHGALLHRARCHAAQQLPVQS